MIGEEISAVVLDFLNTSKLLKVVNVIAITLILKVKRPSHVSDFRPISYCLVLYKCIKPSLFATNLSLCCLVLCLRHKVLLSQIEVSSIIFCCVKIS